jgi:hypothetical protein
VFEAGYNAVALALDIMQEEKDTGVLELDKMQ